MYRKRLCAARSHARKVQTVGRTVDVPLLDEIDSGALEKASL